MAALLVVLTAAFFLLCQGAAAQTAGADPEPIDPRIVEQARDLPASLIPDLVARMSDEEVRALLLARLGTAATASVAREPAMVSMMMEGSVTLARARDRLVELLGSFDDIPSAFATTVQALTVARPWYHPFTMLALFLVIIVAGYVAEAIYQRATRGATAAVEGANPQALGAKLRLLLARLVLALGGLAIFALVAVVTFLSLWQGHEPTRFAVAAYFQALLAVRVVALCSRLLLAPAAPQLRLMAMDDRTARFLHRQVLIVAFITAFGLVTTALIRTFATDQTGLRLLMILLGLAICLTTAQAFVRARHGISAALMPPGHARPLRNFVAQAWPWLAAGLTLAIWFVYFVGSLLDRTLPAAGGVATIIAIMVVPIIVVALERAALGIGSQRGNLWLEMQRVFLNATRLVVLVATLVILARLWGFDLVSMARQGFGFSVIKALVDLLLVSLLAYLGWEVSRVLIDRRLADESVDHATTGAGEPGDHGGVSRVATLLPIAKLSIQVAILVIGAMLALSSLGVNIGPLLAGAGVVGLAIGFGAQTLVKDIVSGVFFLVDDAFRIGEYIDVGSVKGTVEKISIRSLRLRHHRGALHTIPFGAISHLTNYSRDWVVLKLEFRLAFDTDVQLVKRLFKKIGQDLLQHPEVGPDFIEPFKSQGVYSTDDDAIILRAKFMAKPGRQFMIRRELYDAVQKAFAENDIHLASRAVRVQVSDDDGPQARAEAARGAAASLRSSQTKPVAV